MDTVVVCTVLLVFGASITLYSEDGWMLLLVAMLIPEENAKDLVEISESIKKGLDIVPVSRMDEVLARAMTRKPEPIEWDETTTTAPALPDEAPVEGEAATLTAH